MMGKTKPGFFLLLFASQPPLPPLKGGVQGAGLGFCLLSILLLATCCTYDHQEEITCSPPAVVSFSRDIQPIFDAHCAMIDCHAGALPAGNLNLEAGLSYAKLHHPGSGYIDTLKPTFSVLYAQMISVTNPMPPTGKLDDCTLGLILGWMGQGAKNN